MAAGIICVRDSSGYRPRMISNAGFSCSSGSFLGRDAPKACRRMIRQLADRPAGNAQQKTIKYSSNATTGNTCGHLLPTNFPELVTTGPIIQLTLLSNLINQPSRHTHSYTIQLNLPTPVLIIFYNLQPRFYVLRS